MKRIFFAMAAMMIWSSALGAPAATEPSTRPDTDLPQPWHLVDLWWNFASATPHFQSLDLDVTIDRDVPPSVNLYVSPLGLGTLGGIDCYGGLQTNANGWTSRTDPTRKFIGHGAIFSRWGKHNLSVDQARGGEDSVFEAAGYEGDFVSVRRPVAWRKGTYTYSLRACDTEKVDGQDFTWVSCFVTAHETGESRYIGSLRFEGKDLTWGNHEAAFVEVYDTAVIPRSEVPDVVVTFGYPRVNGQAPKLKNVSVIHPGPGETLGSPNCAAAAVSGSSVVVTVSQPFERDVKDRRYKLMPGMPTTEP